MPSLTDELIAETSAENEGESYIDKLVGEDKKYKEANDLAKAYAHIAVHVKTLEEENKELRGAQQASEAFVNELRTIRNDGEEEVVQPTSSAPSNVASPEMVKQTVSDMLEERDRQSLAETNRTNSARLLVERYGNLDAAGRFIKQVINQDPAIKATIDDLSLNNPQALIKLLSSYETGDSPGQGAQNAPGTENKPSANALVSTDGSKLTWSQCQQIRKEDPATYKSPEFRQLMAEAELEYEKEGKDFFAT